MPSERDGFALTQWVRTNCASMHVTIRRRQAEQHGSSNFAGAMWQRIKERIEAL